MRGGGVEMITVFFTNGTKIEFSMATEVRAGGFLQSDEPGVKSDRQ